jgi:hypothetical protein
MFALALLCLAAVPIGAAGDEASGRVRGTVVDKSGGVMPGVTVVVSAPDGKILATTVTDGTGSYILNDLPPGVVHLTFDLAGFSTGSVDVTIQAGAESRRVQTLELASRSETVVVVGTPSTALPAPPRLEVPVIAPPPPIVVTPVPAHDHESICGPAKPDAKAESLGTIRAVKHGEQRDLAAKGDELLIEGGTETGLTVGRNVVVRRTYPVRSNIDMSVTGEHIAGVLQVVNAREHVASAVVIYACDEVMYGDSLGAFNPEPIRTPEPAGTPDFENAARILFADAGQTLGAPRRMMVIDRGRAYGLRAGQRVTLFRRDGRRVKPTVTGDAIIVAVRADSATIRLATVSDIIEAGDFAAPNRASGTR